MCSSAISINSSIGSSCRAALCASFHAVCGDIAPNDSPGINVMVLYIHSVYIIANSGKQVTQRISILDSERTLNEILIIRVAQC